MYEYIEGFVTKTLINYVVVDINGVGYKIIVPNPYKFKENEKYRIYIYNHIREDEYSLYGFSSEEEREMFLKLLGVKGMGPKMTMPILAMGSINGIVDAIDRENILYLKKFPKIGEKLARSESTNNDNDELVLALESLGSKNNDIKNIINKVDATLPIESQIKEALKLLLR